MSHGALTSIGEGVGRVSTGHPTTTTTTTMEGVSRDVARPEPAPSSGSAFPSPGAGLGPAWCLPWLWFELNSSALCSAGAAPHGKQTDFCLQTALSPSYSPGKRTSAKSPWQGSRENSLTRWPRPQSPGNQA